MDTFGISRAEAIDMLKGGGQGPEIRNDRQMPESELPPRKYREWYDKIDWEDEYGPKRSTSGLEHWAEGPQTGEWVGKPNYLEKSNIAPQMKFNQGGRIGYAGGTPSTEQLEQYYRNLEEEKKRRRLQRELYEQRFGGPGPILEAASGGLAGLLGE